MGYMLTNLWLSLDNVPTKLRNAIQLSRLRNQLEREIMNNNHVTRCEVEHTYTNENGEDGILVLVLTLIDAYTGRGAKWGISRIRVKKSSAAA